MKKTGRSCDEMCMKVSSSLWKSKLSARKENASLCEGFKPLKCGSRSELPASVSTLSGNNSPSIFIQKPSKKLTDFQHRILLKNIGNLWPPDSDVCDVSDEDLLHISSRIKWFKRWMKGIHYSPTRHSKVNVQNTLEYWLFNHSYLHKTKVHKVRLRTGLSTRCIEAWMEWRKSDLTLNLRRQMLNHIFVENKYPEALTMKTLSVHTSLHEKDIQAWFLVARSLAGATDFNQANKDELILWRMFNRCRQVGFVDDGHIDLITDLLDIDAVAVYKVFKYWCEKHNIACQANSRNYLVVEEWFEMFNKQDMDEERSQWVSKFIGAGTSESSKPGSTNQPEPEIFEPEVEISGINHQNSRTPKLNTTCVTNSSDNFRRISTPSLKEDDPAMLLFSEHFHRYVRRKLKKLRRNQLSSGIPKRATVKTRRKSKKIVRKATNYPSFHKQDVPEVKFVACLKPGTNKPTNQKQTNIAMTTLCSESLCRIKTTNTPRHHQPLECGGRSEVVEELYNLMNESDGDDSDEILTVETDSEGDKDTKISTTSPVTEDGDSRNCEVLKMDECNPAASLFYLFQTPSKL